MATTPNFGVFLDFAHPFLTEVDFRIECLQKHTHVMALSQEFAILSISFAEIYKMHYYIEVYFIKQFELGVNPDSSTKKGSGMAERTKYLVNKH